MGDFVPGLLDNRKFVKMVKGEADESYSVHHVEMPLKPEVIPYEHQKRAFLIACKLPSCGLFMEQGTGKTLPTIAAIGHRGMQREIRKVLITAPLSVLAVWEEQFEEFAWFSVGYKLWMLDGKVREKEKILMHLISKKDDRVMDIVILNYDSVHTLEFLLTRWKPDMIVADESQMIKRHQALRTKSMIKVGRVAKIKMLLTGTPITESPLDFFTQYKFLDHKVFGKNFKKFKRRFTVMGGYGGFKVKRYKNLKALAREAYSIGYRVTKDEALDLPPVVDQIMYCYLGKEARKVYKEMDKKFITEFLGGPDSRAPIILTKIMRLQQITGGFLKRKDGSYVHTGREKLNLLEEILEGFPKDRKLVIFYKFSPEIKAIKEVVRKSGRTVEEISGSVSVAKRKQFRLQFQRETHPQVLGVQVSTGGRGIGLTAADTAIFYSHDSSFEKNYQAKKRLDRIGQTRPVTYIHLIAKDTRDEEVYESLQKKVDLFTLIMDKYKKGGNVMSKKHSKKRKVQRSRVPVTPEEDKLVLDRLKKLKEDVEDENEKEVEVPVAKRKKKSGTKQGHPAAAKTKAAEAKRKAKVEEVEEEAGDENLVTVKGLASELETTPTALRRRLRNSRLEKPSGRWEWPEDHPDLDIIREWDMSENGNGHEEEEEEVEEIKPKKGKSKSASQPELEDGEEEEEDDLQSELEAMTKKELKALCRESDIVIPEGASKADLVEFLVEAGDEDEAEEDEAEDDEELEFSDMTKAELIEYCDEEEIELPKGKLSKSDIIAAIEEALEEDDEEEDEEDDDEEEFDYEELTKAELKELCGEREIDIPAKASKGKIIELLMEWDNGKDE